ncbi:hypothetical protein BU15DRAFT_65725 [Melanogaster broomeanus]|nr:hypothetical protein BU15DRAFT_65725 [Melanogaster broomeanus]
MPSCTGFAVERRRRHIEMIEDICPVLKVMTGFRWGLGRPGPGPSKNAFEGHPTKATAGMLYRPFTGDCALDTARRVEEHACTSVQCVQTRAQRSLRRQLAGDGHAYHVDVEQLDAFDKEYKEVPYLRRDEFLADRWRQVHAINEHASECEARHEDSMVQARNYERGKAKLARGETTPTIAISKVVLLQEVYSTAVADTVYRELAMLSRDYEGG